LVSLLGKPDVSPKQATSLVQAIELVRLKQSFAVPSLETVVPGVFSSSFYSVIDRALAHDREKRFSNADEFLNSLSTFLTSPIQALAKTRGPVRRQLFYWKNRISHTLTPSPGLTLEKRQAESRKKWFHIALPYSNHGWFWATACTLLCLILGGWLTWMIRTPEFISNAAKGVNPGAFPTTVRDRYLEKISKQQIDGSTQPIQLSSASRARIATRLLNQGLCEEAAILLEPMDTTLAAKPGPWLNKGIAEICLGKYETGLEAYRRLIHLDGANRSNPQIISEIRHLIENDSSRTLALKFASAELDMSSIASKQTSLDPSTRHSVVKMLEHMGRNNLIDWITVLQLDLDQTKNCKRRTRIVRKLSNIIDQRALWVLKNARHQRRGNGKKVSLKHGCISKHLDKSIEKLTKDLHL